MFFGGGFPGFDMPGGFGGGPRRGGGGPVNNSRYYEVLGVPKDADEATIKKVRKSRGRRTDPAGRLCKFGSAARRAPGVVGACPCRDKEGTQHSSEHLHTLHRCCRRCWVLQAHRKAALKHHPDKGGDEEKFKEVRFLRSNTPDRLDQLRAWLLALACRWVAVPAAHLPSWWACSGGLAPTKQQPHVCCGQPPANLACCLSLLSAPVCCLTDQRGV